LGLIVFPITKNKRERLDNHKTRKAALNERAIESQSYINNEK